MKIIESHYEEEAKAFYGRYGFAASPANPMTLVLSLKSAALVTLGSLEPVGSLPPHSVQIFDVLQSRDCPIGFHDLPTAWPVAGGDRHHPGANNRPSRRGGDVSGVGIM